MRLRVDFVYTLYDVERNIADTDSPTRLDARRRRSRRVAKALHQWTRQQRQKIPDGSATARAIDYSLNRWTALTRFLDDGDLPIDNNWVENCIRMPTCAMCWSGCPRWLRAA